MSFDTRAIRADDWQEVSANLQGWQFRNKNVPKPGENDTGDQFWSSVGEPDVRTGVIYLRRKL